MPDIFTDLFARSPHNPILSPNPKNNWEALKVYNCGALYASQKYHIFYRAVDKDGVSSVGYAYSTDGENFYRQNAPVIKPESEHEKKGVEDPRVTRVGDKYYLTYTAYDGDTARLCLATSRDLKNWERHGLMLPGWEAGRAKSFSVSWDAAQQSSAHKNEWVKSGAIFPEKISGQYSMIFGDRNLWLATSKDGLKWEPLWEPFIEPRRGNYFDSVHVEMGPPPIKTDKGWLLIYHGISRQIEYRLGWLLIDKNNPELIIRRSNQPIFEPKAAYELTGTIDLTGDGRPKVIFCCGAVMVGDTLRIYYGAGDTVICTATAKLADVLNAR